MPGQNYSTMSEFILFGFSAFPQQLLPVLFLLYLLMFLFTLLGNLLIMATIWFECRLHTPMYLFLCALSISEILFTVAITPRMLADLLSTHRSITFVSCGPVRRGGGPSFFMVMAMIVTGAICHRTAYNVLMSPLTVPLFHLTFCGLMIHHSCLSLLSLLKLTCGNKTSSVIMGVMLVCVTALIGCLFLIILSYVFIVAAILRIPSPEGRHKTFSTCVSHLTVVVTHYSFASLIYLKPKGLHSMYSDALMATTYTVFTPFLSPIIFSLRNKELKNAINKNFYRKFCTLSS
uniref:G-protein coupled receptors family 1 profile domain-containing protein n=1 Tax=Rhinopithecus bieti TaxID=61621 RepID=A0A2K6K7V7_RHIBE